MEYFQGLWNNQPNTVIGLGVAILVLLGIYITLLQYLLSKKLSTFSRSSKILEPPLEPLSHVRM